MEIIYGRNAVSEALKSQRPGAKVNQIMLAEGVEEKTGGPVATLQSLAASHKPPVPVKKVPRLELANMALMLAWPCAPVRAMAPASAAASMSQTSTSSERAACWVIASKWLAAIRPQPTKANLTLRSMIGA